LLVGKSAAKADVATPAISAPIRTFFIEISLFRTQREELDLPAPEMARSITPIVSKSLLRRQHNRIGQYG
jgi:hypothetical protein